ncbi:MAG: hypothetical protein V1772_10920 [Chloroflexota bacterium]
MEQAKDRAIVRVLRKLSAMRATFGEQEQQILDALIVREEAEVEAHMRKEFMDTEARTPKPDEVRAHMRKEFMDTEARTPKPDEARAHMRKEFMDTEARTPEPDEARAHARTSAEPEARVGSAKVPGPSLRVTFDPASGEYRII